MKMHNYTKFLVSYLMWFTVLYLVRLSRKCWNRCAISNCKFVITRFSGLVENQS